MIAVGGIILNIISVFLSAYVFIILGNVILSWVMQPTHPVKQFLNFLTEPIVAPIRNLLSPLTSKSNIPLDFSPIVALLVIQFVRGLVEMLRVYIS